MKGEQRSKLAIRQLLTTDAIVTNGGHANEVLGLAVDAPCTIGPQWRYRKAAKIGRYNDSYLSDFDASVLTDTHKESGQSRD